MTWQGKGMAQHIAPYTRYREDNLAHKKTEIK